MTSATAVFAAVMMASVELLNACVPPVCYPPTTVVPAYIFGETNNLLVIFAIIVGAVACLVILLCVTSLICCHYYRHNAHKAPRVVKRIFVTKQWPAREKKDNIKLVHHPVVQQPNIIAVQPPVSMKPPTLSLAVFENSPNPTVPVIKARLDSHMTIAINREH